MLGKTAEEVMPGASARSRRRRRTGVSSNNAGGVWNHEFFWSVMAKARHRTSQPSAELHEAAIDQSFKGGFETL